MADIQSNSKKLKDSGFTIKWMENKEKILNNSETTELKDRENNKLLN